MSALRRMPFQFGVICCLSRPTLIDQALDSRRNCSNRDDGGDHQSDHPSGLVGQRSNQARLELSEVFFRGKVVAVALNPTDSLLKIFQN